MKTGFLVAKLPGKLKYVIELVNQHLLKKLYIYVTANNQPHPGNNEWVSKRIVDLYSTSTRLFPNLDVQIILNELKKPDRRNIELNDLDVDVIILPNNCSKERISGPENLHTKLWVTYNEDELLDCPNFKFSNMKMYPNVILGGTFDRLHNGHKILLSEALLRCTNKITVGVTDESMLTGKTLFELIEPSTKRIQEVQNFIKVVDGTVEYDVILISDMYGPTKYDPCLNMIVVSAETHKGGFKINELRKEKNLNELDIHVVELAQDSKKHDIEESKISSSNTRLRLLGTYIKTPQPRPELPSNPYVIGLTGGVASGKSSICEYLTVLGAGVIDCDKIAHQLYKPKTDIYYKLIEFFGNSIVSQNGEINRKALGSIVFSDHEKLQILNELLWPEIIKSALEECNRLYYDEGKEIVVLEAAVLFKANWQEKVHEVWSTIIPQNEAVSRLMRRNNLMELDAKMRINAQLSNREIVQRSNVIFCSLWSYEFTREQVDRAWKAVQQILQK